MKTNIKATQQQTKEHNRNLVLRNLFDHEAISRAEIAQITGLTRTTVSELVCELMDQGLVHEIGFGESLGGKSPILLSLIPNSRYIIGVDLARERFLGTICNLRGEILLRTEQKVSDCNSDQALEALYQILDQLVHSDFQPQVGIGIGTPGLVNTAEGLVVDAVNLDWKNLPLSNLLTDRYKKPVFILNDSQAATLGEFTYGQVHPASQNLILINARHGIGSGIIINGKLFQGDGGGAGEIGHISVAPNSELVCRCGNTGCLETVASTHAVIHHIQSNLVQKSSSSVLSEKIGSLQFKDVLQAYTDHDPVTREAVRVAGEFMGQAISSLIGTLNIEQIILSGDMAAFGEDWLQVIKQTCFKKSLKELAHHAKIELGTLGADCVVLGAAALVLSDSSILFSSTQA